ncbi:MAG: hypothetical protein ABJC39_11060 [Chloroflexota bacterium]
MAQPSAGQLSPSPTTSVTATSAAPIPEALRHTWIAEPREIPGLDEPAVEAVIVMNRTTMKFNANDNGKLVLASLTSAVDARTLRFELQSDDSACHRGDIGTYSYQLSATGRALSLGVLQDPCVGRIAALEGSWNRAGTCSAGGVCLGDMDAGTHVSAVFTPFEPPSTWHDDYGRFAFTVPDGWANLEDGKDDYVLATRGAAPDTDILLIAGVAPHVQDAACSELAAPEPGVGTSPLAIAKWIATIPGLITTKPIPAEVGGIRGVTLDVSVSPASTHHCSFIDVAGAQLFSPSDPQSEFDFGVWGDGRLRLFLLDLGESRTLMIDIEAPDKATWDALIPKAMPIVGSFSFIH